MPNVLIHKASELRSETRAAVEAELGRSLRDTEEVSIMALASHEAPTGRARAEAEEALQEHLAHIDRATENVPPQELEETLDEALRSVRHGYRERQ
jgi:hypothetical protein